MGGTEEDSNTYAKPKETPARCHSHTVSAFLVSAFPLVPQEHDSNLKNVLKPWLESAEGVSARCLLAPAGENQP